MTEIVLAASDFADLRQQLLGGADESCAVLFAGSTVRTDGSHRLLVRDALIPEPSDYSRRGPIEAELNPQFVARVSKRARENGESVVFTHSHPGTDAPEFSRTDWEGEQHLASFFARRQPGVIHAAMVVSEGGVCARGLGQLEAARVVAVGSDLQVLTDSLAAQGQLREVFDRQVRAFGVEGQKSLERLTVGIVGLGGMGSLVAQQLAHLGVRRFILVDPDTLEVSNLNRVANATPADVGTAKMSLADDYIRRVAPDASVRGIKGDVTRVSVSRELADASVLFGCTDSHGSRAVLQQVSYQYLIPCIDTGTTIIARGGCISHIIGRVQLLAPGFACLTCSGLLNPAEVRRDMMSEFERQSDPYLVGAREPAPAVMSLNGTVASLSVTMLLSVACGVPMEGRYLLYDAKLSSLRRAHSQPDPDCHVCSRSGAFARGDSWPLPGRRD